MEEELKPCPFCSSIPILRDLAGWEIHCKCGVEMVLPEPDKGPLIAAWNRRSTIAAPAQEPFAYFQLNSGWGIWEQVEPTAKDRLGVVAAYRTPASTAAPVVPEWWHEMQGTLVAMESWEHNRDVQWGDDWMLKIPESLFKRIGKAMLSAAPKPDA